MVGALVVVVVDVTVVVVVAAALELAVSDVGALVTAAAVVGTTDSLGVATAPEVSETDPATGASGDVPGAVTESVEPVVPAGA